MARRGNLKSISVPITLGATAVPLSIALLVGWVLLLAQRIRSGTDIAGDVWLLVLGLVFFIVIMTVLVLFSIFLVREILEVRRQDSFIDSVTHELKSPLASLKLCLETLAREGIDPAQREQLREMMLDDVDRLSSFIDDVLQASKLAHEGVGLNLSDVDLGALVRECAEAATLRHRLPSGAVTVEVPVGELVTTDRVALRIVLKNLVDNAVKYSEHPVQVHIRSEVDSRGRTLLEVEDRGIGIPPKALKRVFHRFYRVQHTKVRERKGTGLGLFVVSALVRNLGGRVEAHSEGVGAGTTMRVILPSTRGLPTPRPEAPPLEEVP